MEGVNNETRTLHPLGVIGNGDPGRVGGGTYTMPGGNNSKDPTIQDYENIFGPAARDIKLDLQRNKRHARWHLPDALKGSNPYLTDRIDGLITDTTSSPFTTILLPYKYIENVDAKIKWNVWSFDEGMASRVPYESAARTLTQTKRSYAGYTIRHGLAITMEHNFMMSDKGRENFKDQLRQLVGCIQYTNNMDVHIALITAQSYAKERAERYYMSGKTNHQLIREYIDLFGFMSKNTNAMDIMIEDAKAVLRTWGAAEPNFLLCNSKLTFQMTMIPEKTQYLTEGPDGIRRLKEGPNISTYRGLNIIHSMSFSMEDGAPPRDVLRRRVRVAEYYRIPWEKGIQDKHFGFYDESKDAWQKIAWKQLFAMAQIGEVEDRNDDDYDNKRWNKPSFGGLDSDDDDDSDNNDGISVPKGYKTITTRLPNPTSNLTVDYEITRKEWDSIKANDRSNCVGQLLNLLLPEKYGPPDKIGSQGAGGVEYTAADIDNAPAAGQNQLLNPLVERLSSDEVNLCLAEFAAEVDSNECRKCADDAHVGRGDPNLIAERIVNNLFKNRADADFIKKSNAAFAKYLKHYLLGNTKRIPGHVYKLLQQMNWQGFENKGELLPEEERIKNFENLIAAAFGGVHLENVKVLKPDEWELVVVRPNIEHNMLGIIMGRGGLNDLGATFWGQTELSCYDDSMHGIWGMSYKYNEKAIVINNKNLIRLWDVAYDGYNGGKDCTHVNWMNEDSLRRFEEATYDMNRPYEGVSMMVMAFRNVDDTDPWPSPILFHDAGYNKGNQSISIDAEGANFIRQDPFRVFNRPSYWDRYKSYLEKMPDFSKLHNTKSAGNASEENETQACCLAFQGTFQVYNKGVLEQEVTGSGHHGRDYVGVASVRAGKGITLGSMMPMPVSTVKIM